MRELGVPARYVSGYRVENDEFTKTESQEEEYRYECSVPDSDAHAWAEVYLDDYGWLPVEMTPSEEDSAERDKIRGTYTDPEQDQAAMDPADEILLRRRHSRQNSDPGSIRCFRCTDRSDVNRQNGVRMEADSMYHKTDRSTGK